jgi:hypothetical protein
LPTLGLKARAAPGAEKNLVGFVVLTILRILTAVRMDPIAVAWGFCGFFLNSHATPSPLN